MYSQDESVNDVELDNKIEIHLRLCLIDDENLILNIDEYQRMIFLYQVEDKLIDTD
jgi:hypothetical protein